MKIPIAKCDFSPADIAALCKPLESGWVSQGPYVAEFERKWCEFTGSGHSVATTSCTTALHLSLAALGIGPGDEVIVPSFTWVATANVVEALGAKPVFCDIDLATFNMDPALLKQLICEKTKAIIPVHLFGLPAEIERICQIAGDNSLLVVEDAACGFGARCKGRHVGTFGDTGCFSFHPRKAITTGEGGMVTTNNQELAEVLRALRNHGATASDYERHHKSKPYMLPDFPYLGYNYRMTDIQGSLGSSQMDRAGEILQKRLSWAKRYNEALTDTPWLIRPRQTADSFHGFQAYVCLFQPEISEGMCYSPDRVREVNKQRNTFMDYLENKGISTRPGTHAVHCLTYYAKKYSLPPDSCPRSLIADRCSVALPLFPSMTDEEFDYVITAIARYNY
jgi:perosamine synthetase